jgi:hypothetical protein
MIASSGPLHELSLVHNQPPMPARLTRSCSIVRCRPTRIGSEKGRDRPRDDRWLPIGAALDEVASSAPGQFGIVKPIPATGSNPRARNRKCVPSGIVGQVPGATSTISVRPPWLRHT